MDQRRRTDVAIALVVGRLQSVIQIFASILICLTLIRDFFSDDTRTPQQGKWSLGSTEGLKCA